MEIPIKMDDLGVPIFSETSIYFRGPSPAHDASGVREGLGRGPGP